MAVDALEARISRLERENRRWRAWCLFALLAGTSIAAMGQALPRGERIEAESVKASKFLLDDGKGRGIAMLGYRVGGNGPSLTFIDREGNVRLALCSSMIAEDYYKDLPAGMTVFGRAGGGGSLQAILYQVPGADSAREIPVIAVTDKGDPEGSVSMTVRKGVASIELSGADGQKVIKVPE